MILLDSSYDFGEHEVLFVKIVARVPDIWLDTSFGSKWSKYSFSASDSKVMIILDSYYDSGENEVLFVKIGARVLDL